MTVPRSSLGAKTLPGKYFTSRDIYQRETISIFKKQWICVGRDASIPRAGDFFLHEMDGESLIIVRAEDGRVNCFFNVCRHRGTRLKEDRCGHTQKRIQCPYHAWGYDLDGQLKSAPNMHDVAGFDGGDYPLRSVPCAVWQGFVFVNLDGECASFESCFHPILTRFDDWMLEDLVSAYQIAYDVQANWKVIFQNYSECYHCSLVHPQLSPATSVETCSNDFEEGPFLGGPMVLTEGFKTFSVDGSLCGDLFPRLSAKDRNRVYFYTLFPSLFVSPHPDYVLTHRIERQDVDSTRIVCDWLLPQTVMDRPEFDLATAIEFWDLTNRQDWHVCQLTYQGVCSESYQPGPYSNLESVLAAFDRHYLQIIQEGKR